MTDSPIPQKLSLHTEQQKQPMQQTWQPEHVRTDHMRRTPAHEQLHPLPGL